MMKPDDMQYFDKLLVEVDEEALSPEEQKERRIMKLLLKIKNGTPPMRKSAMRQVEGGGGSCVWVIIIGGRGLFGVGVLCGRDCCMACCGVAK